MVSLYYTSRIFHCNISAFYYLAILTGSWALYTFDHLLDAKKTLGQDINSTYNFHAHHFSLLTWLSAISALIAIIVSMFLLYTKLFFLLLIIGIWTSVYMFTNKFLNARFKRIFLKEFMITTGYAAAVIGPSLILTEKLTLANGLFAGSFWIITIMNVILFSVYDQKTDTTYDWHGLSRFVTSKQMKGIFYGLATLNILILSWLILIAPRETKVYDAVFFPMTGLLLWIFIDKKRFKHNGRYASLADAVYLLPLVFIFFN